MKEIWKDIDGYNGVYKVSNIGNVINAKKNKKLKQQIDRYGYPQIKLSKNGYGCYKNIHRLVAKAFIPNPKNKPQVNHINHIRSDNRTENLEWNTAIENVYNKKYYCNGHKIIRMSLFDIKKAHKMYKKGYSISEISYIFNIKKSVMSIILQYTYFKT